MSVWKVIGHGKYCSAMCIVAAETGSQAVGLAASVGVDWPGAGKLEFPDGELGDNDMVGGGYELIAELNYTGDSPRILATHVHGE